MGRVIAAAILFLLACGSVEAGPVVGLGATSRGNAGAIAGQGFGAACRTPLSGSACVARHYRRNCPGVDVRYKGV